ncbi:MAG: hypothetical protein NTV72_02775 [Candidatus Taylorbacteria bacterium]|nr:hypothetical protein [Candidatus Taylorbacteria bacterium]
MNNKIYILFLIIVILFVSILSLRVIPGNFDKDDDAKLLIQGKTTLEPFQDVHGNSVFMTTVSIFEEGSAVLTYNRAIAGARNTGFKGGKFFSLFPLGMSIISLPAYSLGHIINFGQGSVWIFMSILAILASILIFLISSEVFKFSKTISLTNSLIFSFASLAWGFSTVLYQHNTAVILILTMFYAVWKYRISGKKSFSWAIISMGLYGISVFFDYPNLLMMAPIFLYFFLPLEKSDKTYDNKKEKVKIYLIIISAVLFFLIIISANFLNNSKMYGKWNVMSNTIPLFDGYNFADLIKRENGSILEQDDISRNFDKSLIVDNLISVSFAQGRGIFILCPIFLLSILGLYLNRKKINQEMFVLLSIILVNIIIYGMFYNPFGGLSTGTRYFIPTTSILSVFFGYWLIIPLTRAKKAITLFFIFFSIFNVAALALTKVVDNQIVSTSIWGIKNMTDIMTGISGSVVYNFLFKSWCSLFTYYLFVAAIPCFIIYFVLKKVWSNKELYE